MVFRSFPPPAPGAPTLRITISREGKVYAGGRLVTYAVLDSLLTALQGAHGEAWLYAEASDRLRGALADSALKKVATAIVRHQLPNKIAAKADFSDLKPATHN